MRWLLLVLAACKFAPAVGSGDGGVPSDGRGIDGPVIDAALVDAPPDTPPIDARDCNSVTLPAGCTATSAFGCSGSASCFVVCTNSRSFTNARGACSPGTLAVLNEPVENDCVRAFVVASGTSNNVWIGLEQLNTPAQPLDNWFWVDGTPVTLDGWGNSPDQPDDGNGSENGSEDCGNLEPAVGFAWNDDGCGESRPYACELP